MKRNSNCNVFFDISRNNPSIFSLTNSSSNCQFDIISFLIAPPEVLLKFFKTTEASQCDIRHFGFLRILNAISHNAFSEVSFFKKILKISISHIILKACLV